ncbi:MAG: phosphoribosyl-ATP diphosphatase [Nevskia sp.]|nr:phosphoribosyl-ATP diphosphatase [Nevskia sp.]
MSRTSQSDAVLEQLLGVLQARKQADPAQSYVAGLYRKGTDAILKKIGEEAAEVLIAAKNCAAATDRSALVHELADLWFHTLVLMAAYDLPLDALTGELARRAGRSGLEEKASRTAV